MPNLVSTKLHPPSPMPRWIQRLSLNKLLDEGVTLNRRLTLVSAPAGYGKTTCISEWLYARSKFSRAWLSLEPADDDPVRFFAYFVAALQHIDLNIELPILQLLYSEQLPHAEIIANTLINSLIEIEERFIIVLDDFHVIQDGFILEVLEQLLSNAPQSLDIILITREDPPLHLARLRAHNQLTEIRAKDLRFSLPDMDCFFKEVMGISLSNTDLAALESKTEGWIVGLQLTGLSIQEHPNPSILIAALGGSHRFILSYLTEEVLNQQSSEIQQFLLQTSILNLLNTDLCNAVTGKSDGEAMLEYLFKANLFVIALDNEQKWYRYHHLFASLLRDLQAEMLEGKTSELHQRASHWYMQTGMVSEAIHHALAAEDYGTTVHLLENHAMEFVEQGYAKTVHNWVQSLPLEWRTQSPKTNLAFAWMHLLRGAYTEADLYLAHVGSVIGRAEYHPILDEATSDLKAEWLVLRALFLFMQNHMTDSIDKATEALKLASSSDNKVRGLAQYVCGSVFRVRGEFAQAIEAYQLAIQHGRMAENHIAETWGATGLALMAFERGQLQLAFDIATPLTARLQRSISLHPINAVIYGIIAEIHYQWNQLDEAQHNSAQALSLSILGGNRSGMIGSQIVLSRVHQIKGNLEEATEEIQKAVDLLQVNTPDYVRQEVLYQQVSLNLVRNRLAMAQMLLQAQGFSYEDGFTYPEFPSAEQLTHSMGLVYNSSLNFLLHQAQTKRNPGILNSGIMLANGLIQTVLKSQYILVAIEALLLRAQMYAMLNDMTASQADIKHAIELSYPEGIKGIFIEQGFPIAHILMNLTELETNQQLYVDRLLKAFPEVKAGTKTLVEPLTDRELDVLKRMAEGLKYKEIAASLAISVNTVRYHVKGIYSKLYVNTRTQAIKTARQLNII